MNTIFIRELRLPAWIGLYAHEKIAPPTIEIELDMQLASDEVFRSGKVRDARPFENDERGFRTERPRPGGKFERGPIPNEAGMTRMFVSLGKTHGVLPKDIVGMMYREAGLPDGSLGRITLFPKHSLVDVPEQFADQAIRNTRNSKLRGKAFRMDVDRGPV
mgnify:CR=1 FL=1